MGSQVFTLSFFPNITPTLTATGNTAGLSYGIVKLPYFDGLYAIGISETNIGVNLVSVTGTLSYRRKCRTRTVAVAFDNGGVISPVLDNDFGLIVSVPCASSDRPVTLALTAVTEVA